MLEKIKHFLHIVIGVTIGVYLGGLLFIFIDYRNNPAIYALQSAPWYAKILTQSVIFGAVLLIELAALLFVSKKIKQRKE